MNNLVVNRQKIHKIAAIWANKNLIRLEVFFIIIGFFNILLPVIFESYYGLVKKISIIRYFSKSYSTFTGFASVHFYLMVLLFIIQLLIQVSARKNVRYF